MALKGVRQARVDDNNSGANISGHFYLHDHLGSTRITVSPDGACHSLQSDFPFGRARFNHSDRQPDPYAYAGKERDLVSGLSYFGLRHMDSNTGSFTSVDSLSAQLAETSRSDPQRFNAYAYCGRNPINCADPDGAFFLSLANEMYNAASDIGMINDSEYYAEMAYVLNRNYEIAQQLNDGGKRADRVLQQIETNLKQMQGWVKDATVAELSAIAGKAMVGRSAKSLRNKAIANGVTPKLSAQRYENNRSAGELGMSFGLDSGSDFGNELTENLRIQSTVENWFKAGGDSNSSPIGFEPVMGGLWHSDSKTWFYRDVSGAIESMRN
jgi:RHS repeat-associated protein